MSATPHNGHDLRDESIAELVKRLAEQTNTLVHQEIELAKAELSEKGRIAGAGAAMLGAAAFVGLLAAGALTACFIALLQTAIDHTWLAALIVAVVYAAIAAPLAMRGRDRIRAGDPARTRADHREREGGRGMGQDPDAIRHEVEQTREQMGETIDALGYKADVKGRARERVSDTVEGVKEKVGMATGKVSDATPDAEQVKQGARRAAGVAQENPLGLAVGAMAAGFLAGMLLPSSRVEDEKLGPMADQVKQQVRETGEEALEHGKQVAQSAAQSAMETAREESREHGEQLAQSARENAGSVSSS